jgi:hypothetical protein
VRLHTPARHDSPVSSYTEWGPLMEVIVGEVDNGYVPARVDDTDLSYRLFYGANISASGADVPAATSGLELKAVSSRASGSRSTRASSIRLACPPSPKGRQRTRRP